MWQFRRSKRRSCFTSAEEGGRLVLFADELSFSIAKLDFSAEKSAD